jgi:hypothetical protein
VAKHWPLRPQPPRAWLLAMLHRLRLQLPLLPPIPQGQHRLLMLIRLRPLKILRKQLLIQQRMTHQKTYQALRQTLQPLTLKPPLKVRKLRRNR